MPLIRISIRKGRDGAYKRALAEGVYEALRESFDVPEDDKFVVIHEHEDDAFVFAPSYLGIAHDAGLVLIQITVSNTRSQAQKQALYSAIVARLARDPGIEPRNVFINLLEVVKENWSFGDGVAQYV